MFLEIDYDSIKEYSDNYTYYHSNNILFNFDEILKIFDSTPFSKFSDTIQEFIPEINDYDHIKNRLLDIQMNRLLDLYDVDIDYIKNNVEMQIVLNKFNKFYVQTPHVDVGPIISYGQIFFSKNDQYKHFGLDVFKNNNGKKFKPEIEYNGKWWAIKQDDKSYDDLYKHKILEKINTIDYVRNNFYMIICNEHTWHSVNEITADDVRQSIVIQFWLNDGLKYRKY